MEELINNLQLRVKQLYFIIKIVAKLFTNNIISLANYTCTLLNLYFVRFHIIQISFLLLL